MSQNSFKKDAVGKGLKSLLQNIDADIKKNVATVNFNIPNSSISRILIDKISVNPLQPRKDFNEKELLELAESIKIHDLIQPITVCKITHDLYQIISGERRFRAAKIAGLKDIPAYIRQANSKQENLELALLENLQRSDLNAIEIALSYQQLIDECQLTHEELSQRMGKERSTITNYIRLLKLPPNIQIAVRNNSISMGHARSLSAIENVDQQLKIFQEIVNKNLSVRATEEWIKQYQASQNTIPKNSNQNNSTTNNSLYKSIEDAFVNHFNSKVQLKHNHKKNKGTITIHYFNKEELTNIMQKLNIHI